VAAAIASAIEDALGAPGTIFETPMTPEAVWRIAAAARAD
jgi:CO/xanthine dehydrogenase Mo-binding subunit